MRYNFAETVSQDREMSYIIVKNHHTHASIVRQIVSYITFLRIRDIKTLALHVTSFSLMADRQPRKARLNAKVEKQK